MFSSEFEQMNKSSLSGIRKQFDDIDRQLMKLLGQRVQLSKQIAQVKKLKNIPIVQEENWDKKMKKRTLENKRIKLNPDYLEQVFSIIHKESIRIQQQNF